MCLFGSLYARGRLHIADAFADLDSGDAQRRTHVTIDRVTGGTNEGFLFDNDVLTSNGRLVFRTSLTVERPTVEEAAWLAASLRAIDLGILRVGSSKAGGRLALAAPPTASGPHHELFTALEPSGVPDGGA
jgi:CRISPR/Cas system CSM-associated protein Csm3 (group 7 of RAMP superfamily)